MARASSKPPEARQDGYFRFGSPGRRGFFGGLTRPFEPSISRLSILFRIYFSWLLNAEHEVFTGRVIFGTFVSLFGALVLSLSMESLPTLLPLPEAFVDILRWHWP